MPSILRRRKEAAWDLLQDSLFAPSLGASVPGAAGGIAAYAAAVAALNPILWYRFRETSGTAIANSGSLGATGNSVWTPGAGALGQTGRLGLIEAYDFDALASFGQTPINAAFSALTDITEMWLVKADGNGEGNSGTLHAFGTGNAHELRLIVGMFLIALVQYSVTVSLRTTTAAVPTGSWVWLIHRHRSSDKLSRTYITAPGATVTEAASAAPTAGSGTISTQASDYFIGNRSGANRTWDGLIDEHLLFGSELSIADIQQIVNLSAV